MVPTFVAIHQEAVRTPHLNVLNEILRRIAITSQVLLCLSDLFIAGELVCTS